MFLYMQGVPLAKIGSQVQILSLKNLKTYDLEPDGYFKFKVQDFF